MEDILPLVWDKEGKNTGTQMTDEERKQALEKAKEIEERMKHMTFGGDYKHGRHVQKYTHKST